MTLECTSTCIIQFYLPDKCILIIRSVHTTYFFIYFLAFDFCRFCVVIRFFIPATTANDLRLRKEHNILIFNPFSAVFVKCTDYNQQLVVFIVEEYHTVDSYIVQWSKWQVCNMMVVTSSLVISRFFFYIHFLTLQTRILAIRLLHQL